MSSSSTQRTKIASPTKIPNAITRVLSWGYGLGIGYQNRKFDRGIGVTKLDRPVISIGNLSAGGTGKTPIVHWVAQQLIEAGKHPAIAMRGYRALPCEMGDEEREHREALPGVPVVAQPDRIAGLEKLFASDEGEQVDCVILDDGFQHRKIARDVDVVLIDASSPPYRDALLPRGFLRDPASSLARADAVVITHREMVSDRQLDELVRWVETHASGCPVAVASHVWEHVSAYTWDGERWDHEVRTIGQTAGERLVGVCAIGNPEGFFFQMKQAGWDVVGQRALRDHDSYDSNTVGQVMNLLKTSDGSGICVTRKDWVKAKDQLVAFAGLLVIVPDLGVQFQTGEDLLRELIASR